MKLGHILCKSLCIYGSQVPACVIGGWGRAGSVGLEAVMGMGRAQTQAHKGWREYYLLVTRSIRLVTAQAWSRCLSRSRRCLWLCALPQRQRITLLIYPVTPML